MSQYGWRRQHLVAVVLIVSTVLSGASVARAAPMEGAQSEPAQMQGDTSSDPAARAAAMRQVATSCADDVTRFCPELGDDPTPRDTAICLRAYHVDLSFSCRAAISAVTR
jgi:hypothetical protein